MGGESRIISDRTKERSVAPASDGTFAAGTRPGTGYSAAIVPTQDHQRAESNDGFVQAHAKERPSSATHDGVVTVLGSTLAAGTVFSRTITSPPLVSAVAMRSPSRHRGYLKQGPLATTVLDLRPVGDTGNIVPPVAGTKSRSISRV